MHSAEHGQVQWSPLVFSVQSSNLQAPAGWCALEFNSPHGHVLVLFRILSGTSYRVQASGPSGNPVLNLHLGKLPGVVSVTAPFRTRVSGKIKKKWHVHVPGGTECPTTWHDTPGSGTSSEKHPDTPTGGTIGSPFYSGCCEWRIPPNGHMSQIHMFPNPGVHRKPSTPNDGIKCRASRKSPVVALEPPMKRTGSTFVPLLPHGKVTE